MTQLGGQQRLLRSMTIITGPADMGFGTFICTASRLAVRSLKLEHVLLHSISRSAPTEASAQ